jgi:hypothetical protein
MPGCAKEFGYARAYVARTVAPILLALALIFGAAACGDDSGDEFKDQYNQAVRPLSTLGDDIGDSLSGAGGQSNQELGAQFEKLADRANQTRKNLAELDPPEDATDQFGELLASLKQAVGDLRAVGASAREGDPAEAEQATQELVESGQRVQEAEADFKDAVEG